MTLLLDTHTLIWWREGSRKLGRRARRVIETDAEAVRLSAATIWEIAIKCQIGRLKLKEPTEPWMRRVLVESRFQTLAVVAEHAIGVLSLPMHHADPFDRLLIAQAQVEGLTIVTADAQFGPYNVALLDARA